MPRVVWESARLGARIEYVTFLGLSGALPLFVIAMVGALGGVLLALVAMPHLTISGVLCLALGAWYAALPVIPWDERGLLLRRRPWRAAVFVAPTDVVWRPRPRYVGRHLLARPVRGKPVRFPLRRIRRSAARRLSADLDHAAAPVAARVRGWALATRGARASPRCATVRRPRR